MQISLQRFIYYAKVATARHSHAPLNHYHDLTGMHTPVDQYEVVRGDISMRRVILLKGEKKRQRLKLPAQQMNREVSREKRNPFSLLTRLASCIITI